MRTLVILVVSLASALGIGPAEAAPTVTIAAAGFVSCGSPTAEVGLVLESQNGSFVYTEQYINTPLAGCGSTAPFVVSSSQPCPLFASSISQSSSTSSSTYTITQYQYLPTSVAMTCSGSLLIKVTIVLTVPVAGLIAYSETVCASGIHCFVPTTGSLSGVAI